MNLDKGAQATNFRKIWKAPETRIVSEAGRDIGWLQNRIEDGALFLAQIFLDPAFQNRGIGTNVLKGMLKDAEDSDLAMTLGVVRNNPALRLYKRLGFYVTGEDERKFYMRREPGVAAPIANLRG